MGNPYSFSRAEITVSDIEASKKILRRFPMAVFTHFSYVCNLAGSKDVLAWNGNSAQDVKTYNAIRSLEYELGIVASLEVESSGVVVHPGNFPDRKMGLEAIGKSINKINFAKGSKLVLENSAGQGTSLATTFTEIRTILDCVEESKRGNIGVCIDTCHIYAYGEYDLSITGEVDRMFGEFDSLIGLDKLSLVHLNDSETVRGSKKDRHALLGEGRIWKGCLDKLVYLLNMCKRIGVPMVLETDMLDMLTLANL
jgi:deoxyribonuclease-4